MSKGTGVLRALEVVGVPPDEVMAIGDAENDLSMFEAVGLSVAVGMRDERIRDVVDYITIGTDGLPLISYYDATSANLKVTHCSNTFCVPYFRRR